MSPPTRSASPSAPSQTAAPATPKSPTVSSAAPPVVEREFERDLELERPTHAASTSPPDADVEAPSLASVNQRVRDLVADHPAAAVLGAVAAGFVVGRLLSRA